MIVYFNSFNMKKTKYSRSKAFKAESILSKKIFSRENEFAQLNGVFIEKYNLFLR